MSERSVTFFACCRAADARERRVVFAGALPDVYYGAPLLTRKADVSSVDRGVAIHELAHCIAALAVPGNVVLLVRGTGQPQAFVDSSSAHWLHHAVWIAGGPAGQRWADRHSRSSTDAEIAKTVARLDAGSAGHCDACAVARVVAANVAREQVSGVIRAIENAALEIMRKPAVWRAVESLADLLVEKGALLGDEIEEIATKYFRPGSLRLEMNGVNVNLIEELP